MAGEMLAVAEPYLHQNMHPTILVAAYCKALEDALAIADRLAFSIDIENQEQLMAMVRSCVGTKFINRFGDKMMELALNAVQAIVVENERGKKDIDIKHYIRIEKVPGGDLDECMVLDGIMLNKDIVHPKMRRRIENPRIILLDSNLEYKKGENMTNIEMKAERDFVAALQQEEKFIEEMCSHIIALKPDVLITEKGVSGALDGETCLSFSLFEPSLSFLLFLFSFFSFLFFFFDSPLFSLFCLIFQSIIFLHPSYSLFFPFFTQTSPFII
jgi:T-complex protein 1 subunit gamma